ncbi:MAG: DNA polymerase III subunit delta [Acidobacteriota bacterium]|nr:MAG: DNA polymerase III subunit delta [Acidobacteriota bacterium]
MKRQATGNTLKEFRDFLKQIENGQIGPLYLFEGTELYLREQALRKLTEAAVDAGVRDFNYAVVSAVEEGLDEALGLARQYPMISARRMVVVKDFETISDDRQIEALKDYFRDPSETTVLVFVTNGLDNRRTISTILRKGCETVRFDPLDEQTGAPNWVRDYVHQAGGAIDAGTAAYLVGMVGTSLLRLTTELDKLLAYAGEKGRITRAEIDELTLYTHEHTNFEITDAIINGDRRRALRVLDHIFTNPPENPQTLSLFILGAIASNYRRMLMAKELMRQNVPNSELAKALGMSPYAVTHINEKARKMQTGKLISGIRRIAETDAALKSSMATPRLLIEFLICELCPGR